MNKRIALIVTLITLHIGLKASVPDRPVAGSGAALGLTGISINSTWSTLQNQAALAWQNDYWVGIHHENRYLVKELGLSAIAGIIPTSTGTFGVNLSHFGYSQFNVTRACIAYGMKFSDKFSAGVGLNLHHLQIAGDYENKNAYTVEGGLMYMPTSKLTLGAYVFNPTRSSFDEQQSLSPILGLGISYFPSEKVMLALQVDDNTETKPAIRGGVEYSPIKNIAVRLGYSSENPQGLTGGFGWSIKQIQVDLSFGYHSVLGYTPQLSVSYCFAKQKVN
jgi:opacity protein-like surface antigen